ncbi:hypothetical protein J4E70_11395 [Pseudohalocynthiibacter aestuariivivens]|nr:hypothetical protein [Pseudohalocynthiibacter aestuariivivens]
MMGPQLTPARLFYGFDLEAHVPDDHTLRQIDYFLDVEGLRTQLRPFYVISVVLQSTRNSLFRGW